MCLMTHQGGCGRGVNFSEVVIAALQTGHVSVLEVGAKLSHGSVWVVCDASDVLVIIDLS